MEIKHREQTNQAANAIAKEPKPVIVKQFLKFMLGGVMLVFVLSLALLISSYLTEDMADVQIIAWILLGWAFLFFPLILFMFGSRKSPVKIWYIFDKNGVTQLERNSILKHSEIRISYEDVRAAEWIRPTVVNHIVGIFFFKFHQARFPRTLKILSKTGVRIEIIVGKRVLKRIITTFELRVDFAKKATNRSS